MATFRAVFKLLSRREQWQLVLILLFMLPNALMQVAGIASIMPFIAVLGDPEMVTNNTIISWVYTTIGEPPLQHFLVMLAGAALALLLIGNTLAAFTTWITLRFTFMRVHSLSYKLLGKYLNRPYEFFLQRNPSDLAKNVIEEVNQLVNGFLMPLLRLATHGTVALAIVILLIAVDPAVAAGTALVLGSAYLGIYMTFRPFLTKLGQRRLDANRRRFKSNHEAFSAIKELKVAGREANYLRSYGEASYAFARTQANYSLMSQIPRYALEAVAFGAILVIALYLAAEQTMQNVLPILALYALAGYRLMPAMQQIFDNATRLRFAAPAVNRINAEMLAPDYDFQSSAEQPSIEHIPHLNRALHLEGINYGYPGMDTPILQDINLTIRARTTVAIVGESGAGKSTLVDIILGLLEPKDGKIIVDGTALSDQTLPYWRNRTGYVPQSIYLTDDTLRRNIAFGIPDREIDEDAIISAAKTAAIHDFITGELPDGYDTITGDRGIRLSGGQRQRIGIARALYHNPDLLILDEATSALDGSTEAAVLDAINRLSGKKTIIMIAHRLSTVRDCEQLFFLKMGTLVCSGTYDELVDQQPGFRKMANQGQV